MLFIFPNQWIPDSVIKALCWTFIHSLWQGVVAAIVAGIIVSSTRKTKAHLRYNLFVLLSAFFLLAVGVSFFVQLSHFNAPERSSPFITINTSDTFPVSLAEGTSQITLPKETVINKFTALCNGHATFLMLSWFLFFVVKSLHTFSGLYYIHRLRKIGICPPLEAWNDKMKQLSSALGIRKPVALLESRLVDVPLTIGCLKATVLVPIGLLTRLSPEQVEAVLLHELAHIRRHDYLVNLLQSFVETIFFFNPSLLWISALIRREREACCDDMVLEHTAHKRPYLEALVSFQEYSGIHARQAMALVSQKNHLLHRIKRMLTRENQNLNIMERALLVLGIIAITAFGFIVKPETPVTDTLPTATLSKPVVAAINNKSFLGRNSPDTIKPGHKEVLDGFEQVKDDEDTKKQLERESAGSEKPYWVIDGKSFVVGRNAWARAKGFTDVIFVDGKRMMPDELNRTIKKNSIVAVGVVDGEPAKEKYGLAQPVLEIYINTRPKTDWMQLTLAKEKEAILHEQEANEALLKEQEQKNTEMKQLYNLQHQLDIQEKELQEPEQMAQKQMQGEMVRKQKPEVAEQQLLIKEQEARVKEQNAIMNAVKPELLKDGLIHEGEHYELMINSSEMLLNGKKQAAPIHHKYIELISNKRNRAFGDKEQWSIKVL